MVLRVQDVQYTSYMASTPVHPLFVGTPYMRMYESFVARLGCGFLSFFEDFSPSTRTFTQRTTCGNLPIINNITITMPVLIILTAKAMIEMIRKGEYRRLATRVMLAAVLVIACCLLLRAIPLTFSSSPTISSYRETSLNLRFRSMRHDPARIPLLVREHLSAKRRPIAISEGPQISSYEDDN